MRQVLADMIAEHERLIRQATLLAPLTERFFREACIGPGQRILDLGSGVGDVAMLAARLVGPSGEVVGVERDTRSIARARFRVAEAGLHHVTFTQSDASRLSGDKPTAYLPLWSACASLTRESLQCSGGNTEMGLALHSTFQRAGLPAPNLRMEILLGDDPSARWIGFDKLAFRFWSLLITGEKTKKPVPCVALVGAWSHRPA
jgi:SAM-dependent methyltransferase